MGADMIDPDYLEGEMADRALDNRAWAHNPLPFSVSFTPTGFLAGLTETITRRKGVKTLSATAFRCRF